MKTLHIFQQLFEQFKTGVVIVDGKGAICLANEAYGKMTGFSINELIGENIHSFLDSHALKNGLLEGGAAIKRKGKEDLFKWLYVNPIKNEDGTTAYYALIFRNFHVYGYDPLTKLPNRYLLMKQLKKSIEKAIEKRTELAVFFIDLDRFKLINDTLGHSNGDLLLKEASERIKAAIGDNNHLYRMGGDEFVCVIEHFGKEAEQYAGDIIQAFSSPVQLEMTDIYVTASIGISIFPYDGDDPETLITNADTAMYEVKKSGKNSFKKVNIEKNAGAYEELLLENSLRKAIKDEEFTLFFQPQINLKTGKMTAMEALIRWEHKDLGLISPGDFIPIAEETGLILAIDEWVLKKACLEAKTWQDNGLPPTKVAVNLSAAQFLHPGLIEKIDRILTETSLSPEFLELEITENMIMHDIQLAIQVLGKIKSRGIQISIDDFGTGYSSLSYLKDLPLDTIKIDRSFIKDIDKDMHSRSLTKAIVTLAHDLNLKVITEGIETKKQLALIKNQSCDAVQGYYFSRPLNSEMTMEYLRNYENSVQENLQDK